MKKLDIGLGALLWVVALGALVYTQFQIQELNTSLKLTQDYLEVVEEVAAGNMRSMVEAGQGLVENIDVTMRHFDQRVSIMEQTLDIGCGKL